MYRNHVSLPTTQGLHDRDRQLSLLREECKEVQSDQKRNSITASDMSREIDRLRKVRSVGAQCGV